jgi:hypothetical protein
MLRLNETELRPCPVLDQPRPTKAIYTGSRMQIPWYIGWPILIAFSVGILFMVARRAPYYPSKYPRGFWQMQSALEAEDAWLLASDGIQLHAWWVRAPELLSSHCICTGMRKTPLTAFCQSEKSPPQVRRF